MNEERRDPGLFGLSVGRIGELLERMKGRESPSPSTDLLASAERQVPERFHRFEQMEAFLELERAGRLAERFGIANPFFRVHEGVARDTTRIEGRDCLNFATYNYLDLNGHPEVAQAACEAIARYGTSASASRLVSGNKVVHQELEEALRELLGTEDCLAFVSGHATNVSTIGCLLGPRDLVLHDALAHNSLVQGALLSGAHRLPFPHNDVEALDRLLHERRDRHEKVLVCVEGLYSMDGDLPPLEELLRLRKKYRFLLLVDEAHSLGVLGATGRGIAEHLGLARDQVDIWMGTLSKTFAGCGGFVAGCRALVEMLRYNAPGFVYSVGMSPPLAAASRRAIEIMLREPERLQRLQENTRLFLDLARESGLDTGRAQGFAIVPVILGSSARAARLSHRLLERGLNVQPILTPAVEERAARLRFFLSAAHREEQIRVAVAAITECMEGL